MKTIALLEDHPQTIEDLRQAFQGNPDFQVVAEAYDAETAEAEFPALEPDIILIDLILQDQERGSHCIRALRTRLPRSIIIATTVIPDSKMVFQCFRRGASGYVLKTDFVNDPASTIHQILNGTITMTASVRNRMERYVSSVPDELWKMFESQTGLTISPKERRILAMFARGLRNQEIDSLLGYGKDTSRKALPNIYPKLGAIDRNEAFVFFLDGLYKTKPDWADD